MLNNWSEATIKNNKQTLHYYRTGKTKPSLVLAHGLTDNSLCWSRLANALAADYDLIMIDARGHGLSSHAASYTPEDHASDLITLIETLELSKPALLGHSMGAVNAAYVAAARPDLIGALLLEDPPWLAESLERDLGAWRENLLMTKTQPLAGIIARGKNENPAWHEIEFEAWAKAKQQLDPNVLNWIKQSDVFSAWRAQVTKFSCPTLLITGDTDVRVSPEVSKEASLLNPLLSVATIENAGHSIRRDQFQAYLSAVTSFLASLDT